MEYNEKACYNLIAYTIRSCFLPVVYKTKSKDREQIRKKQEAIEKTKQARIKFADSKVLKMWCDCSDNFEYNKLRKKIIKYNKYN